MSAKNRQCVVALAEGGLYGPFPDKDSARTWAERRFPGRVWNVLPLESAD